ISSRNGPGASTGARGRTARPAGRLRMPPAPPEDDRKDRVAGRGGEWDPGGVFQGAAPVTFRILGLAPEPFAPLFDLDDDALLARAIHRFVADEPHAAPCRISLDDAEPGER